MNLLKIFKRKPQTKTAKDLEFEKVFKQLMKEPKEKQKEEET